MKIPNFFIVGAPKCGTTALSNYLKSHEDIFMSTPKEPHYFAKEFSKWFYPCESTQDYLKLYEDVKENHCAVGEASVLYLYSKNAINEIYKFNSKAKIIVMLRNPMDLAYSWHSQAVFNTDETVNDFRTAWNLQDNRNKGLDIPKHCRIPETLKYKEISELGNQVEKLLKVFPREQIHFILIDDFKKDTLTVYKEVLSFLNVKYLGKKEFPVINENKVHKSKKIVNLRRNKIVLFAKKIKKFIGLENVAIMKPIYDFNLKTVKREPLDIEFKRELLNCFLPQIKKLETLLNLDLEHWKQV